VNIRRISDPAPAVSVAEAKVHLRVDGDADHDLIAGLIAGAVDYLDGWTGVLGRAIEAQTVEMTLDSWPAAVKLPLGPVDPDSVVIVYSAGGADQVLSVAAYQVDVRSIVEAVVTPVGTWPSPARSIRVRWTAGAGASPSDKQMILQMVGTGYLNREASGAAAQETPFGPNSRAFATRVWEF